MNKTIIQDDLVVDGNLVAKDSAVSVGGRVTGDIEAKSAEILPSGQVKGTVVADDTIVSGTLEGRVKCNALTLADRAKVKADIKARTMTMSPGASVVGRVEIDGG